ncbi:Deoxyribodipyrimidine photolyase [Enterobacter cloacae]|nr:Deoxyribodipyrimidine photolyase [Enterobacter cloacae]
MQAICQQYAVTHLYYNYQYEFNEQQRDRQLEKSLAGVVCEGFDDSGCIKFSRRLKMPLSNA